MTRFAITRLFILLCVLMTTMPASALERMDERVAACSACHGAQGHSQQESYYPSIAGKPAQYLYKQLRHFRQGQRHHTVMAELLAPLSDDYLQQIATYYAAQAPRPGVASFELSHTEARAAEKLVYHGDTASKVPACAQCHGQSLHGMQPDIPGLTGLDSEYITAQLGAWRSGVRSTSPADCMGEIARRLTTQQITLVSQWLPGQVTSTEDQPEVAKRLPMDCASAAEEKRATKPSDPMTRGEYLVRVGNCIGCHTRRDGPPLAGGRPISTPFGKVYSSNLTPDDKTGLGQWTKSDFWTALNQGVSVDGRLLYPAFPYTHYTLITREDSDSMLDYLKSQAPVFRPSTPHALRFPFNTQAALRIWRLLFFKRGQFEAVAERDTDWNRGRYLVEGLGHCSACHGQRNAFGAVQAARAFAGSMLPDQSWFAPPLTAPQNNAERTELHKLLASGHSARAVTSGPMAAVVSDSLQFLSDDDLNAMGLYIESLPPSEATKVATLTVSSGLREKQMHEGEALYRQHCADCHGENGQGEVDVYPALAGNSSVQSATPVNAIRTLKFGGYGPSTQTRPYPFGMPPFAHQLKNEELAAVLTYIRNTWGNQASAVSPAEVRR